MTSLVESELGSTRAKPSDHRPIFQFTFYVYVFFTNVLGPVLVPLRVFEVWNTATLVYTNIAFVFLFALAVGLGSLLPRHFVTTLLIVFLAMGMLVGLPNVGDDQDTLRNFASHTFQILSGYVMFSMGTTRGGLLWNENAMRSLMWACIGAELIGSVLIFAYGIQLGLGGYLVGGGSSFLALCFFLPRNRVIALIALAALVLSGKRGPLVAGLMIFGLHLMLPRLRQLHFKISFSTLIAIGAGFVGAALVTVWARPDVVDQVYASVEQRIESIPDAFSSEEETKLTAGGGRYQEIDALTYEFTPLDWLVGRGFGYHVSYFVDESFIEIHQAHFTPATLAARFGLPLTLLLLGGIGWAVVRGIRRRMSDALAPDLDETLLRQRETALLYVAGGMAISLTAFTLFIDLYLMFFLGVLVAWTQSAAPARPALPR